MTWTATITAVFDCPFEEVVDEFTQWVSMPHCVEQGLIITPTTAVSDADAIWSRLSQSAKAEWVRGMMPEPSSLADDLALAGLRLPDDECPAGGPHVYEETDSGDAYPTVRRWWACSECGAKPPKQEDDR